MHSQPLVRTVPPVLSFTKGIHFDTLITAPAIVIPLNRMSIVYHRTSTPVHLTILLKLNTGLVHIRLFHLEHERGQGRSQQMISCTAVDVGHRSASEIVVHPHSSAVCGENQYYITVDLRGALPVYRTGRRRVGRGSIASRHHETNTSSNGP